MAFKMTPEAKQRAKEYQDWEEQKKALYANLDNDNLVASAKYFMQQMSPIKWAPGEPIYDATFWHIIIPELLKRVASLPDPSEESEPPPPAA